MTHVLRKFVHSSWRLLLCWLKQCSSLARAAWVSSPKVSSMAFLKFPTSAQTFLVHMLVEPVLYRDNFFVLLGLHSHWRFRLMWIVAAGIRKSCCSSERLGAATSPVYYDKSPAATATRSSLHSRWLPVVITAGHALCTTMCSGLNHQCECSLNVSPVK